MSKKTSTQRHQRINKKRQKRDARNTERFKQNQDILEKLRRAKKSKIEDYTTQLTQAALAGKLRLATEDPFPQSYAAIPNSTRIPFTDSTSAELNWNAAVLHNEAQALNNFTELRQTFSKTILSENYESARQTLKEIRNSFGVSHWLADASLLLAEHADGFKANRETVQLIIKNSKGNSLAQLFAFFASQRVEKKLSSANFLKEIDLFCRRYQPDQQYTRLINLLQFYVAFPSLSAFPQIPFILHRSSTHPAVDRLNNYIRISQILHATENHQTHDTQILQKSTELLSDPRLRNLRILSNPQTKLPNDPVRDQLIALADIYTVGDYEDSAETSRELLAANPDCLEYYELHIKSELYLGRESPPPFKETSIAAKIFNAIRQSIKKTSDTPDAMRTLEKFSFSLDGLRIGSQLHAYVLSQKSPRHPLRPNLFWGLNATATTAKLATSFASQAEALSFLENLGQHYPGSPSVELYTQLFKHDPSALPNHDIPPARRLIYRAHALLKSGHLPEALKDYESLWNDSNVSQPLREGVLVGLFQGYLQAGELTKCASLVADTFLNQRHLLTSLPIEELLNAHEKREAELHSPDISWPIIYFIIYASEGRSRDNEQLHKSYDNFLSAWSFNKPSELAAIQNRIPQHKLVFFLRYLCALEIMDCSVWFESTTELEAERISVCQFLLSIDQGNSETYNQEISRLTQVGMIRKAIQHLDESKVYIDTAGIAQSLDKSFRERFDRYIVFSQLGERLRQTFELTGVEIRPDEPLIVVSNDSIRQFAELFGEIKNRFISSNEYGLDSYLSVRIRHGTLSGQLRSQFERESLITRKNAKNGIYDTNNYWMERLFQNYGPLLNSQADKYLQEFSRQVDAIIDSVKHKWIQIKGPSNSNEGLFDFDYSEVETTVLSAEIASLITKNTKTPSVDDYEIFLHEVFSALWLRTETSLANVVDKIKTTLRDQLTAAIDTMSSNIFNLNPEIRHSQFGSAVTRCRTHIQNEIETVAAWFKNANDKTAPDFDFSLLAQTATEIVKNCFPSSQLSSTHTATPSVPTFRGNLFAFFVDIMFILLENIVKHSKAENPTAIISASTDADRLSICIESTISPLVDTDNLKTQIDRINKIQASALTPKAIRTEGGSGYLKLHKLIRYDLERGNDYNVSLSSNENTLSVRIDMDISRLTP
ncbi:hypothetical protein EJ065_4425 [Corallococcus coralloides]|uniref:Uncharacterized protein n=1 Tax=Corallococcus coralloides TaxID=184914 RepID=A0A410RVT4_CORCK|nr:hypothetical protein [Corallococcus coralloides]QAT85976.1 hypothetical protein EJ065_4425 [Corallococcus coralloides]